MTEREERMPDESRIDLLWRLFNYAARAARKADPVDRVVFHLTRLGSRMCDGPFEEQGLATLADALALTPSIDREFQRAAAFGSIAEAYRKAGKHSTSFEVCHQLLTVARAIAEPPLKAFQLRETADCLFRLGDTDRASRIPNEMVTLSQKETIPAFEFLYIVHAAVAMCRQGCGSKAKSLIEASRHPEFRVRGLIMLAETYADMRNWTLFSELAGLAWGHAVQQDPSDLCALARAYLGFQKPNLTFDILCHLQERALSEPHLLRRLSQLSDLADLYEKAGQRQMARSLVSAVLESIGKVSDSSGKDQVLAQCARVRGATDNVEEAMTIVAQLENRDVKLQVLLHMVWLETCARRAHEAISIIRRVNSPPDRAALLATVATWIHENDTCLTKALDECERWLCSQSPE